MQKHILGDAILGLKSYVKLRKIWKVMKGAG